MSTNTVSTNDIENDHAINANDNTTTTTKPADNDPCLSPILRFYDTDARKEYMEVVQRNSKNMSDLLSHLLKGGSPDDGVAKSKWMEKKKYIYLKVHLFECRHDPDNNSARLLFYYKPPADSGIESGVFRSGLFLVFEASRTHKLVGFQDHPKNLGKKATWYGVKGVPTVESCSVYSPPPEEKSKSKKKK